MIVILPLCPPPLLSRSSKAHPGPVVHISDNPMDEGKVRPLFVFSCMHVFAKHCECLALHFIFFVKHLVMFCNHDELETLIFDGKAAT